MKVAYFVSRFPKVTETFVLYEVLALHENGVEVELYPILRHETEVRHPEVESLASHVHFLPFLSPSVVWANLRFLATRPLRYVRGVSRALRATFGSANFFFGALGMVPKVVACAVDIERRGIQHVHAHFANHPALCAWLVHELTDIPFSFTGHGSDVHVDRRGLAAKVRHSAFALTVSEYNRELLAPELGEEATAKLLVHHCGVDTSLFEPVRSVGGATLRIVCVASLRVVKGHVHLIEACRILAERGVDFECRLVGDGPTRTAVEEQIERSALTDRVRLLGDRPRPGVLETFSWANVAALTSATDAQGRREGIPVALMEAMASGLPVVASRLSGIPELVEDGVTGLLAEPADPTSIAAALERLAGDADLRDRLGRAGRQRVERDFDLHVQAELLAQRFKNGRAATAPRA